MGPDIPADAPRVADGRYALLRRLGEGGMAVVYAAWDRDLAIWRAVKVLLPDYARRASVRRRFEREARTMMSIRHPNLVRVHEVRVEHALPYLVMDLVPGGSLEDWIVRYGVMPPRLVAEYGVEVLSGLAAVHEAGIVHRDIKPQNVLVDHDGVCKLADFGVARVEGGDTRTGVSMGTIGYMAPEQFEDSKSVDPRSDVYSVGATLYVLLTKRPVQDLLRLDEKVALADLPEELRPVVQRCLEYEREDRYPDAPSLLRDLVRARDALPPLAPDVPRLPRPHSDQPPGGSPGEYTELKGLFGTTSGTRTEERPPRPAPLVARALVQVEPTVLTATPPPTPPRAGSRGWLSAALGTIASALAVALGTLLVVAVGVPVAVATGRASVLAAEQDVGDAREILLERVTDPAVLERDLERLGASTAPVPEDRVAYAQSVAERARPVVLGHRTDSDDELSRQRLERVVWAVDRLDAARDRWRVAASDPLGGLAVEVGLARRPD